MESLTTTIVEVSPGWCLFEIPPKKFFSFLQRAPVPSEHHEPPTISNDLEWVLVGGDYDDPLCKTAYCMPAKESEILVDTFLQEHQGNRMGSRVMDVCKRNRLVELVQCTENVVKALEYLEYEDISKINAL